MNLGRAFLRLGVQCAVMDDDYRILLSKRDDLGVWNLPGGRANKGEELAKTAAREVQEETGIIAYVKQPIALYYWPAARRVNVLFSGWRYGGRLLQTTRETVANNFFPEEQLPEMPWHFPVEDAFAAQRPLPRVVTQHPAEVAIIRRKLRWRWIKNLLTGKPEPRFPHFQVSAVGIVRDADASHVLTVGSGTQPRRLLRVVCDGQQAPWEQLAALAEAYGMQNLSLHWVGLWQDTTRDQVEFVFAASLPAAASRFAPPPAGEAAWIAAADAGDILTAHDAAFLRQLTPVYASAPVWTLYAQPQNTLQS